MESSQSPRMVLKAALALAIHLFPEFSSKFSRHDFTLAQLFACLALRQFYNLSYRRTEQLLRDSPQWRQDIGLSTTPDHNTLWRAFDWITMRQVNRALDLIATRFKAIGKLKLSQKPLSIDSTCFETHHRSAHYDRRCRKMLDRQTGKSPKRPGSWGKSVNSSRRRKVGKLPKLAVAVASSCHVILAAKARLGNGSDARDFDDLIVRSCKRAPVKTVVADAGYDSEANHRIARMDLAVRSIIPPGIGRPTSKPPTGRWRRHMARRFSRKADHKLYSQRSQSETVNSMIKRNQGSALRSRTPERQKKEMMLRSLVHNIMLLASELEQKSEE